MVNINLDHISLEHKREALVTYCQKRNLCYDLNTNDECPLFEVASAGGGCFANATPEEIEKNYEIVFGDKEVKEPIEHDGCLECEHLGRDAHDYPCCKCKGTVVPYDEEYKTRPDMFVQREEPIKPIKPAEPPVDMVNHPPHYTSSGMECIDELELVFGTGAVKAFCLCNVWKYRKRALLKNGQEDLDKADWYMAKYKELEEKDNEIHRKLP